MSAPTHIAIIMDGNGRWAQSRELPRVEGHKQGAVAVRRIVEACVKLGVRYLTLFSFSTENWNRSNAEVSALMSLFKLHLEKELPDLMKNDIRLRAIGDLERLPDEVREGIEKDALETKKNDTLDLVLAVSYGGREEILHACQSLAQKAKKGEVEPEEINVDMFSKELWTADIPDPDLLIRSSGEMRISNFLLWQLAYTEIVVTDVLWPDFNEEVLSSCINEFETRERRFGLTSEQISGGTEAG